MPNPIRVLIVDDHPLVRRGIGDLINRQEDMEVVGEADSISGALQMLGQVSPDLLTVDLSLKDGSGLELLKDVKARNPSLKMLVSSMQDETLYAERCIKAGAKGYINKEEATDKVIDAIRVVMSGNIYLSPELSSRMLQRMAGGGPEQLKTPMETLTDRELEVFELIGRGLSTKEVAHKLHLSHKTIETHRENIKSKLSLKNASELNRHAVQWVLENS